MNDWIPEAPPAWIDEQPTTPTIALPELPKIPKNGWMNWAEVGKFFGAVRMDWQGWIPRGHVTLITGPQAVGKSFLMDALMAVYSGGVKTWPDGTPAEIIPGEVLFVETEQLRGAHYERLKAMNANLLRIKHHSTDPMAVAQLPKDLKQFDELLMFLEAKAMFLDSLSGGHGMDENSAEMRGLLQALSALAAKRDIPIMASHHLRKKSHLEADRPALDRVRGSSTITQFCRSVIALWRPDGTTDGPVRVESIKSSFSKPPVPFGFTIGDNAALAFGHAPTEEKNETVTDRVADFLLSTLEDGARPAAGIFEEARLAGYSEVSVKRAKAMLDIVSVRENNRWMWSLPVKGHQTITREEYPIS